jgi:hypothetical protein
MRLDRSRLSSEDFWFRKQPQGSPEPGLTEYCSFRKLLDYLARAIEWRGLPECATLLPVMGDRTFVVLKYYKDNIPSMASCAKCQHKFFTPNTFRRDLALAEQYLREKFAQHTCPKETKGWDGMVPSSKDNIYGGRKG